MLKLWQRNKPKDESGHLLIAATAQPYTVPYVIERSARRTRTIAFAMTPQATLRVIAPLRMRVSTITAILDGQAHTLVHELVKRHRRTVPVPLATFADGSTLSYMGHSCRLRITQDSTQGSFCRIRPRQIIINIPDTALSPDALAAEAKLEFTLALKKRAKLLFKKRMDLWAANMGVSYKRLAVTNPEQRWGSCSADNSIRLNWRLMLAPLSLIDYVVIHELAHCLHKNHGARFWNFVGKTLPDYEARRLLLRRISAQLQL